MKEMIHMLRLSPPAKTLVVWFFAFFVIAFSTGVSAQSQVQQNSGHVIDKSKLQIHGNLRDNAPVRMNNSHRATYRPVNSTMVRKSIKKATRIKYIKSKAKSPKNRHPNPKIRKEVHVHKASFHHHR